MPTPDNSQARISPTITILSRLAMATLLFYAVAVLYAGTVGATWSDAFVEPMMSTGVFAAVLGLPMFGAWMVSRRLTDSGNAG